MVLQLLVRQDHQNTLEVPVHGGARFHLLGVAKYEEGEGGDAGEGISLVVSEFRVHLLDGLPFAVILGA